MSAKYDPAKSSQLFLNDVIAVKPPDASDQWPFSDRICLLLCVSVNACTIQILRLVFPTQKVAVMTYALSDVTAAASSILRSLTINFGASCYRLTGTETPWITGKT